VSLPWRRLRDFYKTQSELQERLLLLHQPWLEDFERHEALSNRVEVGDLHRWVVAAA